MGLLSSWFRKGSRPEATDDALPDVVKFDQLKIYPYVIPASYLDAKQGPATSGLSYPIGHGLLVTLVHDLNGMVRNVREQELKSAGLAIKDAHFQARQNLAELAESRAITAQRFDGPRGQPFIIFTDHWLAAACVLLPDLAKLATQTLGTDRYCICLPQRDAMLIFPSADESFRSEMMAMIHQNEADARKPLSFGLFRLGDEGPVEWSA